MNTSLISSSNHPLDFNHPTSLVLSTTDSIPHISQFILSLIHFLIKTTEQPSFPPFIPLFLHPVLFKLSFLNPFSSIILSTIIITFLLFSLHHQSSSFCFCVCLTCSFQLWSFLLSTTPCFIFVLPFQIKSLFFRHSNHSTTTALTQTHTKAMMKWKREMKEKNSLI